MHLRLWPTNTEIVMLFLMLILFGAVLGYGAREFFYRYHFSFGVTRVLRS